MPGEPPPEQRLTYSQQFRRCGRASCLRCGQGQPGHGPYWYGYWREDGRLRSRYIGKQAPIGTAAPGLVAPAPAQKPSGENPTPSAPPIAQPPRSSGNLASPADMAPAAGPSQNPQPKSGSHQATPSPWQPSSPRIRSRGAAPLATGTNDTTRQETQDTTTHPDPSGSGSFHDPLGSGRGNGEPGPGTSGWSGLSSPRRGNAMRVPPPMPLPALRVRTLGGFAIWRGTRAIPDSSWARRKAASLFKCLLDAPGNRIGREEAADLLWPEAGPTEATNNLKVTIHHLRRILSSGEDSPSLSGGSAYLRSEGEWLRLIAAPGDKGALPAEGWWDAEVFAQTAHAALNGRDSAACEAALALYTGEYLPEDRYESWAAARRDRLRDLHIALQVLLGTLYLEEQRPEQAIRAFQAVLALDPCHEEATRSLIRLYGAAGRQVEATRAYRSLVKALQTDLGIGPDAPTRMLHQDLLAGRLGIPLSPLPAGRDTPDPPATGGDSAHRSATQRAPTSSIPAHRAPAIDTDGFESARPAQPPLTALSNLASGRSLVGREVEMAWLEGQLRQAQAGEGRLAMLRGAAGVGKSLLLASFLLKAQQRGALVLYGHAYRQEGQLPYGVLLEALRSYLLAQPPDALARQCGPLVGGALLAVLPELAHAFRDAPPLSALEPEAERHRLLAAIRALLGEIARTQPVVLALDDLHRADPTAIEAIEYLGRGAGGIPLLIVGSYRPEELGPGHPLAEPGNLAGEAIAGHSLLSLQSLDRPGTRALVDALLDPRPCDEDLHAWVWNKSRGNPFYVTELVAALRKAGALVLRNDRWVLERQEIAAVPIGVRGLIAGRVERLDPSAANLLRICAVLGKEADYLLLRQLCDLGEDRLLAALDVARSAELLAEHLDAGNTIRYGFPHPLIPEAIYQHIPATRRALLHARVGEALLACHAATPAEIAPDLAWHFARAGDHSRATRYALLAGERAAASGALPEALAHYAVAREQLTAPGATPSELLGGLAELDERLGDLRLLGGEFASAQQDFARARVAQLSSARHAELLRKEGVSLFRRGDYDPALRAFDAAEAAYREDGSEATLASVELSRAEVYLRRGQYEHAEAATLQALGTLEADGDAEQGAAGDQQLAIARADHLLGTIALDRGDHQEADQRFRRALAGRKEAGDEQGVAESWHSLGEVAYDRRDHRSAQQCFANGLAIRERLGDQWGIATSLHGLALVARERDDHPTAVRQFSQALDIRERIGDQQGMINSLANLGTLAQAQADFSLAGQCFARSLAIAERIDDQQGVAIAWHNLGRLSCEQGDLCAAANYSRRARRLAARIGFPALEARATLEGARARLQAGRLRQAEALLDHARSLATEHHLIRTAIAAILLLAELRIGQQRQVEACAAAAEAIRRATDAAFPAETAQAQALLARALCL